MLTFPLPGALNGGALAAELAAAGFADADVYVRGADLIVAGPADADRDAVKSVVDNHVPPAPPPDPDDELDAALAAVDTSTVTDTATRDALDAVIAALRGTSGRKGAAAGRRPSQ
jgi:hypothetical protein